MGAIAAKFDHVQSIIIIFIWDMYMITRVKDHTRRDFLSKHNYTLILLENTF